MGWTNEQVAVLIEEYSQHPCLYVVKHKHYHNKHLRSLALNQITERLRILIPSVTEADVQKKFLGLRTTYCNERRKISATLHTGMGEDEVYKPSLWYYNKMAFLNQSLEIRSHKASFQQRPECSKSAESELQYHEETGPSSVDVSEDWSVTEGEYEVQEDFSLVRSSASQGSETPSTRGSPSRQSPVTDVLSKKRKYNRQRKNSDVDQELIMLGEVSRSLGKMSQAVNSGLETPKKTAEDIFGEFVATQLKLLKDEKKNDVQYEIHGILRNALRNN